MSNLSLSVAIGNYDRNRALIDGEVQIDGVNPVFMKLSPEEIFFRAFRHQEFDICELSFSSYTLSVSRGTNDYIAIPAFLSRAFRHSCIYIRNDKGINSPEDLKGKRIGVAEYQLTANVWARALLEEEYGVCPSDITWVRGGMEVADRPEKVKLTLPKGVVMEPAAAGRTLNSLLEEGEIDGFIGPRTLSCFDKGHPNVVRLFSDSRAAGTKYYKKTGVFPIMHVVGVRRSLVEQHNWLPMALLKAFEQSKAAALAALSDTSATKVTLPFVEEQIEDARKLMGNDYFSYGYKNNLKTLETFLDHHYRQGLSERPVKADELFWPATQEGYSI
ncbi:4,5-dihydroxyphthalate decarboxylase [gamma proteobacterium BDW918]|jgi:4,5-dihydroxyphthalate decarboxylase|uniref:ABC transporter substrate-binding protein n=1 Tax=Spongiibacter pelagi TaxID=2760804 RepID=A0A927GXJ3_9GAMM|nr:MULTISPECIES: PhnD/SsuA/transferrin family substrate-binding protein [Cellvibrionales]EIF42732.1 4,5-dihydroxyphthalate decarboxylase [gamma proteobacterium BDW918]MAT94301.1 ABC transporter substrate-binding protein [Halioglobus sp.]MAV31781.1 ABC transporter substrate-binding protein [Cycloclasticus sp.]MAD62707.1 ABC transporter substrate-binding protein [Haliea sp.]MAD65616.1 ABC transporter substrate-binding protein [Haliea sp.]|tara:strand:- start:17199 stop:18191 length:993 start_codon:yes stop_codon:yes gene_type:complete